MKHENNDFGGVYSSRVKIHKYLECGICLWFPSTTMPKNPITEPPAPYKPPLTTIDPTLVPDYPSLTPVYLSMTPVRNNRVAPEGVRRVHPRGLCKSCKRGLMKPSFTVITCCALIAFGPFCIPCCMQDKCKRCGKTGDLYCCWFC